MDSKVLNQNKKGCMKMQTNKKVENLVNYVMKKTYGDIIYHQEIAEVIGSQYGTYQYRSIVNSARKKLLEAGRMIDCIRKSGYKIVEPDNYTDSSVKEVVAGARRIDRGAKIMRHAPVNEMSQAGLESYNKVNDRLHILQAAIAGSKVEITMLSQKVRIH